MTFAEPPKRIFSHMGKVTHGHLRGRNTDQPPFGETLTGNAFAASVTFWEDLLLAGLAEAGRTCKFAGVPSEMFLKMVDHFWLVLKGTPKKNKTTTTTTKKTRTQGNHLEQRQLQECYRNAASSSHTPEEFPQRLRRVSPHRAPGSPRQQLEAHFQLVISRWAVPASPSGRDF